MNTDVIKKPRVCYLRGSYLNPFETQYLVPLQREFDLVVAHPKSHRYDLGLIPIPRIELTCLDYLNGFIPRRIMGRSLPNPFKFFGFEEVLLYLNRFVVNFDLIILPEQSFYFTWQVATYKKLFKYKIITMQDEINPYWYIEKRKIAKRALQVRSETNLFIARSERSKNALISEGVTPEKIHVIGHGVDVNRFFPGKRNTKVCDACGIAPSHLVILFVGRLVWTKGVYVLADAANLLLRDPMIRRLNPVFLIVGDGDERSGFEKRVKQLGVDQSFIFLGEQPYDCLPDIHRLADIFVLPSISSRYILEQFGISIIESMATGVPVISTYCGAIDEVVGDAGVLVQPNDYFRLFQALLKLCKNKELRAELGMRGLERVKKLYTTKAISSATIVAYKDALSA